jgi:hypothetical protein
MDSTATTVWGNGTVKSNSVDGGLIAVGAGGTLAFANSASTNYKLCLAGDLWVGWGGLLTMGSSGAEIPRDSSALLEFQPVTGDGNFGLQCWDFGRVDTGGLSRTSGKNVWRCKLTADVVGANTLNGGSNTNVTNNGAGSNLDATATSFVASNIVDTTTNATHSLGLSGPSVTNTTQVVTLWIARGTGTNNRYARLTLGNNGNQASVTNGCYTDLDLQAGTASAPTAVGTGTATSVTITPYGIGYIVRLTGRVATTASTPWVLLNICNAPGGMSFAGANNIAFYYDRLALVTASSLGDTTFNVDTDTGWLTGDVVCVSSTTRSWGDNELYSLNANAGASSFTSPLYPFGFTYAATHHGTAPAQADIGLLTRNVKIKSNRADWMTFVYFAPFATCNLYWTEFAYTGTNTDRKRGIDFESTNSPYVANPKVISNCSIHDGEYYAVQVSSFGTNSVNASVLNCVTWRHNNMIQVSSVLTLTDWTISGNLLMQSTFNNAALAFFDIGGTCTNNTVCGMQSWGMYFSESNGAAFGTFSGNTVHSCGGGLTFNYPAIGTFANYTAWRNNNAGINALGDISGLVWDGLTLFGNATYNIYVDDASTLNITGSSIISSDPLSTTTTGIYCYYEGVYPFNMQNVDMSGVGTGLTPHTNDFHFNLASGRYGFVTPMGVAVNCKFGAVNLFSTASRDRWTKSSYFGFKSFNQISTDDRLEMKYGQLKTDTSIFNTASPSMRMTPNSTSSAINRLESAPRREGIKVPVNSGSAIGATLAIRKDATYTTGTQPRLIVRANPAVGINADTVLASCTDTLSPAGWTPASLTGILSWWDASVFASMTFSGSTILTVADQGPSGKTLGQNGAIARPTYNATGFNGLPAMMFAANPGQVLCADTFPMGTGNTMTIWMVGYYTSNSINYARLLSYTSSSGHDYNSVGSWCLDRVGVTTTVQMERNAQLAGGTILYSTPVRIIVTVTAAGLITVYVNGTALNSGTSSGNWITNGSFVLGCGKFETNYMDGAIGEAGVATGLASAADIAKLDNYLAGKWGFGYSLGTATWAPLSGTTIAATADGVMEFIVDCSGPGFINIEDWSFTGAATTSGGLKNWFNGLPIVSAGSGGGGGGAGYFAGGFV